MIKSRLPHAQLSKSITVSLVCTCLVSIIINSPASLKLLARAGDQLHMRDFPIYEASLFYPRAV